MTSRKLHSHATVVPLPTIECHLGYVMHRPPSKSACLPFSDYVESIMEVFVDDFSIYGGTFDCVWKT